MTEQSSQISTLRRQRGHIQGQITTLVKVIDDTETRDAFLVQASLETMQKAFDKFDAIQDALEELDEARELPVRATLISAYNSAVAKARKYLQESATVNDALSVKSIPCSSSQSNECAASSQEISIKLPEIPLPVFDGKIENWAGFYDLFTSVVEKSKLSDAGKLAYLKQSVAGKAETLIASYNTTNENYKTALDVLKSKFEFPRRALRRHWAILREFPSNPRDTPAALGAVVDIFQKHLQALKNLGAPIDQWDTTIIDLILTKVNSDTAFQWEITLKDNEMPKYTSLLGFLEKRANSADFSAHIESASRTNQKSGIKKSTFASTSKNATSTLVTTSTTTNTGCKCCNAAESHLLYRCTCFNNITTQERYDFAKKLRLCFNCLNPTCPRSQTSRNQCSSKSRCRRCNRRHHTLLCQAPSAGMATTGNTAEKSVSAPSNTQNSNAPPNLVSVAAVAETSDVTSTVLLGSALIAVAGGDGRFHTLRCIIDSAASTSFITTSAAERIGLQYERTLSPDPVSGIGGGLVFSGIQGHTTCLVKPRHAESPLLPTETTIITKIVHDLPCTRVSSKIRSYYSGLNLADSQFHVVREVDFLLGCDAFGYVYLPGKKFGPAGYPVALESIFGWVVTGRIGHLPNPWSNEIALITVPKTDELLRKFWEIEEVYTTPRAHPDDIEAEETYRKQHYRLPDGRYVVPLMLRGDAPPLGESRALALARLKGIQRRLARNPVLKAQYEDFLKEYETLGHMTLVPPEKYGQAKFYIPHHYVTRQDGENLRLRVVFDASMKTSSNFSLNQAVYSGPKLQIDIFDIILRFRSHQKVFTCDISKMYRQILIRPEEREYQHILWSENGEVKEYELNTVTYGVTSSPFSALRTIRQLKEDEGHKYPMVAPVLEKDIFVDDIATGTRTTTQLLELKREIVNIFKSGGCELSKWASNCAELLAEIPPEHRINSLDLTDSNTVAKILGMHWDAQSDCFFYSAKTEPHDITKRNILRFCARLWDPLGAISPIVLKAKSIIQKLWLQGIDWDSPVPPEIAAEWTQFYEKLPLICSLRIDRCVILPDACFNSLIGFADGSQTAYCATVYVRSESVNGVKVSLLSAKSRVAPTKTISVPRLELCAAKLLATLIEHVKIQYEKVLTFNHVATFTDSQVVLSWVKTTPCKLKTFEANRVSFIQDRIEPSAWKFCPGDQNPSDIGSRGCLADQLENHPLWWSGPQWLADPIGSWPTFKAKLKPILITFTIRYEFWEPLISKFSQLSKLQRVTAWLLRYVRNLTLDAEKRVKSPTLSVHELDQSMTQLIKVIQRKHFLPEIQSLQKNGEVSKDLQSLTPFLDSDGVLRVGGRLKNSDVSFHTKHPILLPKRDHFVYLIIDAYHQRYLHSGPRLLQSMLARTFWIISARSIIRSRLSKCHACFKARPTNSTPLMGDLPFARVNVSKVFLEVQMDFGGPFMIREHRRRNPKLVKAYLSLYVCSATKAVHLEVVSDLTTDALLASIDRFVSRRGLCKKILTDNAKNFVGARNHLRDVYQYLTANKQNFKDQLVARGIEWQFIPPYTPHMGGLHEAGIKTAKYHLKRVIGDQTLTFEELSTVFSKIEAIMNSRPLCHLSTDPSEVNVLTPGHFLIGGPLAALPEYNFEDVKQNRLSRWELLQQITQNFWRIWSRDYIHTLIQRSKWQQRRENLTVGTVVLVADDDTAPTYWRKGIIEEVHPGKDKVVRVVTIKTATGTMKRPAVKVYPLPQH